MSRHASRKTTRTRTRSGILVDDDTYRRSWCFLYARPTSRIKPVSKQCYWLKLESVERTNKPGRFVEDHLTVFDPMLCTSEYLSLLHYDSHRAQTWNNILYAAIRLNNRITLPYNEKKVRMNMAHNKCHCLLRCMDSLETSCWKCNYRVTCACVQYKTFYNVFFKTLLKFHASFHDYECDAKVLGFL